jgi:formiminotetrahydrofolate cyclodeaminase
MKIKDQKVSEFLDNLAAKSPTPGGGAVAALTGAMAASLTEMACNLTIGKKDYREGK